MVKDANTVPLEGGSLGYMLAQAAHAWRTDLATALKPLGLTPPQFFVVASLYRLTIKKGLRPTQQEIAKRIAIDINTASQVIRGLEKRKIISRAPHPRDGRAIELALTAEGQKLAQESTRRAREVNERFFQDSNHQALHEQLSILMHVNKE